MKGYYIILVLLAINRQQIEHQEQADHRVLFGRV